MTDETEGQKQDTSQNGDTSGQPGGSTSPETFTREEVDKIAAKAANDALAKAGRTVKDLETREAKVKEGEDRIADQRRREEEAEEAKLENDPAGLKSLRAKRDLEKKQAEFDRNKSSYDERLAKAEETERELNVSKAAQSTGVNADALMEKVKRFKLTSAEDIKDLASTMAASKPADGGDGDKELHLDSNKGTGGINLDSLSPDEKIKRGLQQKK